MPRAALLEPRKIPVNRSRLRQSQREFLKRAKGQTVLLVTAEADEEEKYVVDKQYFEGLLRQLRSTVETLEVLMDRRLFDQILATADTLEEDLRLGKLHSLEEAFGED